VLVRGGSIEGDPDSATAQLLAGWLSSRCGCAVEVVKSTRTPGPSGVDSVVLRLDQDEEVRLQADRRGGAVISQPFRPESMVALPERGLGDLLGEELRRLDPDEPYSDALEAATGVTGLSERSPVREHVWYDPADPDGSQARKAARAAVHGQRAVPAHDATAADRAPTVPADSVGADEVAQHGEHDEPVTRPQSTRGGAGRSRSASPATPPKKRP
jgi:hypothetical protein